ncbi:MAG TPA: DMT family transporter [Hyphomicrobiaceae bacterium]|nr:DMT family transporter [Hyphomicrobiaceae bacterium]
MPDNHKPTEGYSAPAVPRDPRPIVRDDPIRAVIWITAAMALFAILAACSRKAALMGMHPLQIVFLRNLSATLFLMPMLIMRGRSLLRSNAIHLYGVRVGISIFSMTAWFYALALIPVAEVTAIGFLAPLFGTLGAIVFLGEKVRIRRWTALAIGFVGAMIILRPGTEAFGLGQACAVFNAMSSGLVTVLLKQLSSEDDSGKIVFLTTVLMLPPTLIPALFVWETPGVEYAPVILTIGFTAVLGHYCLMRGFASTDASLVMTFDFSRLPFAVLIGWWMFGEVTDIWTWIGAAIIFASAIYITRREARLRSQARLEKISKKSD